MAENLYRRGQVYWCRFYVPLDQQERLGRKEIAWSLEPETRRSPVPG